MNQSHTFSRNLVVRVITRAIRVIRVIIRILILIREHSIFFRVLTEAVAPYYVEAWRRASVNTLEKIECSLSIEMGQGMVLIG